MNTVTSTPLDLITGALRKLNVQEAGEPINANDSADALQTLNDMLESMSLDKLFIYSPMLSTVAWTPGKFQYQIGNPVAGTFGAVAISGSNQLLITSGLPTLTFGLNSAGATVGGTLTDSASVIPAGTTIVSLVSNTLTMSNAATGSVTTTVTYTSPGDFAINRPLRIRPGFTRITASGNTGLDYWFDVCGIDDYNEIGYKGVPGPWPYLLSYQPTFPYGTIWIYPNPQQAGQVFLWTDIILGDFQTLTQQINLPQGYAEALKLLLAERLAPEYGKTLSADLLRQIAGAVNRIRALNETPVKKLRYDSAIMSGNGRDASFIMHGGFGSNL